MRLLISVLLIVLFCFPLTACWDMVEPNQRAIWTSSAVDLNSNGTVRVSDQIIIPAGINSQAEGGGKKQQSTLVVTSSGDTITDAVNVTQEKLSRKLFAGHRKAIFYSEHFCRQNFKKWIDYTLRIPAHNNRAEVYVVKGSDAKDILKNQPLLEQTSTEAVTKGNKFSFMKERSTDYRTFVRDLLSEGTCPIMQAVEINKESKEELIQIKKIGLFNKQPKLIGFLEGNEAAEALWIARKVTNYTFSESLPDKRKSKVSIITKKLKSNITSEVVGNHIRIHVKLTGMGSISENHSQLNLADRRNLYKVEQIFNKGIQQQVDHTILKLQHQYHCDILGFGEEIHRRYPYYWKKMKGNWPTLFPKVDVETEVNLKIISSGYKGTYLPFEGGWNLH